MQRATPQPPAGGRPSSRPAPRPGSQAVCEAVSSPPRPALPLAEWDVLGDPAEYVALLAREREPGTHQAATQESGAAMEAAVSSELQMPPDVLEMCKAAPEAAEALKAAFLQKSAERADYLSQLALLRQSADKTDYRTLMGLRSGTGAKVLGWQLHERIDEIRQPKALDKWQGQLREWDRVKERLSDVSGKDPDALAMERIDDNRRQKESLMALELATPLQDRYGPITWNMSLRDEWIRELPIGNRFSGLYVTVDEKRQREMTLVRRKSRSDMERTSSLRGSSRWESSALLAARKRQYRSKLATLLPGCGEGVEAMELHAMGYESELADIASREITLEMLEAVLAHSDPSAYDALQEVRRQRQEAEAAQWAQQNDVLEAHVPKFGPALEVSANRLVFEAPPGGSARAALALTNTGTTVLHYRWAPVGAATAAAAGERERFYAVEGAAGDRGVLLPGQSQQVLFMFKPDRPGTYIQRWVLRTEPSLAVNDPPLLLKGIAVGLDGNVLRRRELTVELERRLKMAEVALALSMARERVSTPPGTSRKYASWPADAEEAAAFAAGNMTSHPPLYYNAADFAAAKALWARVHQGLAAVRGALGEEVAAAAAEDGADGATLPMWDGCLAAVAAAAAELGGIAAANELMDAVDGEEAAPAEVPPEVTEALAAAAAEGAAAAAEAAVLHERMQFPTTNTVLSAHAMRGALLVAASAIGDAAERRAQEARERREAAERAAAEGGEAADEEGQPPPPAEEEEEEGDWSEEKRERVTAATRAALCAAAEEFFDRKAAEEAVLGDMLSRRVQALGAAGDVWGAFAAARDRKRLLGIQ